MNADWSRWPELIMAQSQPLMTLDKLASLHVDPEKGINSVSEAWAGASDIVAENISDRADIRELIRKRTLERCRTRFNADS